MTEESDTEKGFKVHDKRRFTGEGEAREEQATGETQEPGEAPPSPNPSPNPSRAPSRAGSRKTAGKSCRPSISPPSSSA